MAPAVSSPLLKLFGVDRPGPGGSLQHIRDKIYQHAWSRVRRDDSKSDFVISETGINRNVPERLIFGEDPFNPGQAPRMPPPACNLHLVNKQVAKDFVRYIYTTNDLEIDVDLKALHTGDGQAALNKIVTLLRNPNFQKHTRKTRLRIHFPAQYPVANLPAFNQAALDEISFAIDDFQNLGHLAIRIVPGQGSLLDYELRLATFPFYPMRMTNWSIRTLNTTTFPYTWDIVQHEAIFLLNKAYQIYLQTGNLTAPIHTPADKKPPQISNNTCNLMPNKNAKGDKPSSLVTSKASLPANGSQKKRDRKKRAAAKAAAVALKAAADGVAQAAIPVGITNHDQTAESVAATAGVNVSNVQLLESKVVAADAQSTKCETDAKEQPLGCRDPLAQTAGIHISHQSSTVPPSTPLSPSQENEIASLRRPSPDKALVVPSPAKSNTVAGRSDVNMKEIPQPLSPAASSVTLPSVIESLEIENIDDPVGITGVSDENTADAQGNIAQKPQTRKRRGKSKNKRQSKVAQSAKSRCDMDSDNNSEVEFEADEVEVVERDGSRAPTYVILQMQDRTADNLSRKTSEYSHDELTRGKWTLLTDEIAIFDHPVSGNASIVPRNARINRYIRQQRRRGVAQGETKDVPKSAKVNSLKKARQVSLRRGHIAANSPLSRAMRPVRPRDTAKKQADLETQSASPEANNKTSSVALLENLLENQNIARIQSEVRQVDERPHELVEHMSEPLVEEHEHSEYESDEESNCIRGVDIDRFNFGRGDQDDSYSYSEGDSTESNTADSLDFPMFQGRPADMEEGQDLELSKTSGPDLEEDVFIEEQLQQGAQMDADDRAPDNDDTTSLPGRKPSTLYPEFGVSLNPVQPDHTSNEVNVPREPILCHMPPNDNSTQRSPFLSPQGQHALEMGAPEMGKAAQDLLPHGPAHQPNGDGQYPAENRECGRRNRQMHHRRGREHGRGPQHGPSNGRGTNQGSHRGSSGPRQGHHGGGRATVPMAIPRREQKENAWAKSAQADDRKFHADNLERQRVLEQDIKAKGMTYADYATPVEDTYIERDQEGKIVTEKHEKIRYGPQSQCTTP